MNPRTPSSNTPPAVRAVLWHRIEDPCPKTWHYIYASIPDRVLLVVTKHQGRLFTELAP